MRQTGRLRCVFIKSFQRGSGSCSAVPPLLSNWAHVLLHGTVRSPDVLLTFVIVETFGVPLQNFPVCWNVLLTNPSLYTDDLRAVFEERSHLVVRINTKTQISRLQFQTN